ncbi:SDR family oxidoreductase [Nakamurella lactea]|uniref:SDR family oxidoreductase n=1 Tax=Nakamurella lactea TaxID=459515 RepID=UPI0004920A88|nr:SDR family oxidoreductase [Nakamurella lactea]
MTIAVTGATGSLGTHLLNSLLTTQEPSSLVAVVRDPAKATDLADRGVAVRVASYDDPAALRAAFDGVDTLMLISGSEPGRRLVQHTNAIDAAVAAGVQRVVYTSASHADTSSLVLAPEHKATEEYLAASGLTYTILRNNWYNENYLPNVETARQTGELVAAAGEGLVASASRADFAEGAAAVLTGAGHENKVYELAGDTAWNFHDFAAVLSEVTGRNVVYRPVDATTMADELVDSGLDEGTAGFVAALDANVAAGALSDADPTLSRLIGRPTTPLLQTLRG